MRHKAFGLFCSRDSSSSPVSGTLKKRVAYLIGAYGLFLSLTAIFLWDTPLAGSDSSMPLSASSLARLVSLPASLAAMAALAHRFNALYEKRPALVRTTFFGVLALGGLLDLFAVPMAAGCCIGVGCGLLFCLFQRELTSLTSKDAGFVVFGAAVISSCPYFALAALPSPGKTVVSVVVLLPLCGMLLRASDGKASALPGLDRPSLETPPDRLPRALAQPLILVGLSGIVVGLFEQLLAGGPSTQAVGAVKMAGLFASGIALLIVWAKTDGQISFNKFYHAMFLMVATTYLLLPALYSGFDYVFAGFAHLAFSIASALMVLTCLNVAQQERLDPIYVYGAFAGIVYGCMALGAIMGLVLAKTSHGNSSSLFIIALVAVYCLSMIGSGVRRRTQEPAEATAAKPYIADDAQPATQAHVIDPSTLRVRFGLSPREAEVCILLGSGRDVPFIAKRLCISENTVRTHTKNIYTKMDIHTKQELLDLMEREGVEP